MGDSKGWEQPFQNAITDSSTAESALWSGADNMSSTSTGTEDVDADARTFKVYTSENPPSAGLLAAGDGGRPPFELRFR